jgi:hypothetical protein
MAAESVPGFARLDEAAGDDLAEMRAVSSGDGLDILVQLHDDRGARRIHVDHKEEVVPDEERTHADGQALSAFVRWAFRTAPWRDDDAAMLVLWGHAYQFAIGQTAPRDGAIDALDFGELTRVLRGVQVAYQANGPGHSRKVFDIVGFDACDLATLEVAIQLRPFADFLLASEMGIPLPGWPYDRFLDRLRTPKGDRRMGPPEVGSYVVRRYCEAYKSTDRAVSLTLLGLERAHEVGARAEILATKLVLSIRRSAAEKAAIIALFERAQTDSGKPFVDIADLCLNLAREADDPSVRQAANDLGDLLISPDPVEPGGSQSGAQRPFILEHGRNAGRTAKLNGCSLYAPHVVGRHDVDATRSAYEQLLFAQRSLWTQMVHNLAHSV